MPGVRVITQLCAPCILQQEGRFAWVFGLAATSGMTNGNANARSSVMASIRRMADYSGVEAHSVEVVSLRKAKNSI